MDQGDIKLAAAIVIGSVILIAGIVGLAAITDKADVVDITDAVGDNRPSKGNPEADVTMVEFSDFQCPACGQAAPTVRKFLEVYGDQVDLIYRHFPITRLHPNALFAAYAAEAARNQGLFWEVHDWLFDNQSLWSSADVTVDYWYEQFGSELGLDEEQFKKDYVSDLVRSAINTDRSDAQRLGVSSTPTFFINGKKVSGSLPFQTFIDETGVTEQGLTVTPAEKLGEDGVEGGSEKELIPSVDGGAQGQNGN